MYKNKKFVEINYFVINVSIERSFLLYMSPTINQMFIFKKFF